MLFLCAWIVSLGAGAQTQTCYVLDQSGEKSGRGDIVTYELSGPGATLTFDAKRNNGASFPTLTISVSTDGNTFSQLAQTWSNGGNGGLGSLSGSYSGHTLSLNPSVKKIKFNISGGLYTGQVKNVKVTRATTLSSSATSLPAFRTTPGETDEKSITVDYNNTYSDAVLTGTCDNSNFVVVQENMEATGSKPIKVQYKPSSVGTHSGTVTLKMGTESKNNYVTTTFTVSGTCYLSYSFSATSVTNNTEFGTTQVDLDGQTGTSVNTSVESSNTSETKTATFKASPVDGYNFIGWYSDDTYQNRVSTSAEYEVTLTSNTTNKSSSSTLYAKFEVDKTAALQAINEFEENYEDLTEDPQAAIDLATAKSALEAATTVDGVNAAVANLKQFDSVTFDENIDNQIEKGNSLTTSRLASSSNGFDITYTSSDPSIIKIEDGNLVAVGVGSAIITATTHGEGHYIGTAKRSFTSFSHDKGTATITIDVPATLTIDDVMDNVYTLSNNTIAAEVTFSEAGVLAYEDGKIKAIGAGKVIMYVSQAENDDWNPVLAEKEITVEKHANEVTWKESPVTSLMALQTIDLTEYASAISGSITYSSSNTEVITIEGNVLTAHKVGNATITASVAATDKFSAASNTLEFTVSLVPTTIKWEQALPALNDRGGNSVTLTASVIDNEGNTISDAIITYKSSAPDVVNVSGNSLTPKSGGSATITASYAGNDIYAAADDVTKDVSVTGYTISSVWVNDWTSAPAAGAQFYIYNTTNKKFLKEGYGEESRDAFVDEIDDASLWTYTSDPKIVSANNSSNFIANRTNEASTNGNGNASNYSINYKDGSFQFQSNANLFGTQYYDVFNNGGIFDGYHNGSHYEWWLISKDQYDFRQINAPKAVNNYLYDEDYAIVVGPIRTALANVCANTTSNFADANAQIASLKKAFDDYLAAIETINTFESEYASKTPDTVNPVNDIDAARRALESAESSDDIAAALAKIKAYDVITITQQPAATLPLHGETTVEATANNAIAYTSSDTEIITMEGNRATAIAEGSATITLTTNTSDTHYAAMPVTTTAIVVTDALILNSTTIANYAPATYGTVVLERTLKAGYNSIAMPFEASLTDLGADKAYQLSLVTYNAKDGYSLYFKEVTSLAANEPYIIHLEEEKMNPTFSNVAVVAAQPVEKEATGGVDRNDVSYRKWKMVSNYAVGFNMDGKYGVVNADGCLKLGATGSTLAPFSAYIENVSDTSLPSDASTETDKQMVKALFLNGASAIEDVMNGKDTLTSDPEAVYDLQGRKASAESKGVRIVIMNDGTTKKVIK